MYTEYDIARNATSPEELQENWDTAFGLQAVDGLKPSKYMVKLASQNINGKCTYAAVEKEIKRYYSSQKDINYAEKEADEVSLRITQLLGSAGFTFGIPTLLYYHKYLFSDTSVDVPEIGIGSFRDYNITKKESVIKYNSVVYADYNSIESLLRFYFEEEKNTSYINLTPKERVTRIADFTSDIWAVHPFGEGNTRTVAVFMQKYLISMGYKVNNNPFKNYSDFFRNALVRANFESHIENVYKDKSFLYDFFENLMLGEEHKINNKDLIMKTKKEMQKATDMSLYF